METHYGHILLPNNATVWLSLPDQSLLSLQLFQES